MLELIEILTGAFSGVMLAVSGALLASGLWIADIFYQIFI